LEILDSRGTQGLRERLITIKRPRTKKEIYIPSNEQLARIPEMLKMLRESDSEENRYLAFLVATVVQFCGRTRALSRLRFDMIEGLDSDEPIVKYIGKHRVKQIKGITNDWYKDFLREWKQFVQQKYENTPYFFPTERNGEITHIEDDWLRTRFKAFMRMCGLPQLTIHSFRYIYATKLYLMGVPPDAIKDILGVDKKTLKYYVKATEERKKKVLFKYMEKVSALPKEKGK
jgi:integrase